MTLAVLTDHARQRIASRLECDSSWLLAQVQHAVDQRHYTRMRPEWVKGSPKFRAARGCRFVRLDDHGVPAVAVIRFDADHTGKPVALVVTVIRRQLAGRLPARGGGRKAQHTRRRAHAQRRRDWEDPTDAW